jgi:hypothetical protein
MKSPETTYQNDSSVHEAGFDSLLTARVAIKLSAKMYHKKSFRESPKTPTKQMVQANRHRSTPSRLSGGAITFVPSTPPPIISPAFLSTTAPIISPSFMNSPSQNRYGLLSSSPGPQGRSSPLPTRMISDIRDDDSRAGTPTSEIDGGVKLSSSSDSLSELAEQPVRSMPGFEDPFWIPYMNQLRVFGTLESRLSLFEIPPAF